MIYEVIIYFNISPANTIIDQVCLAGLDIHNTKKKTQKHGVPVHLQQDVSNFNLCAQILYNITFFKEF